MSCNGVLSLHTMLSCSVFLIFMTWFIMVLCFFMVPALMGSRPSGVQSCYGK